MFVETPLGEVTEPLMRAVVSPIKVAELVLAVGDPVLKLSTAPFT